MKFFLFSLFYLTVHSSEDIDYKTYLQKYVDKYDPMFGWKHFETIKLEDYDIHVINMTSLQWIDASYSNRHIWWHFVNIFVPHKLTRKEHVFYFLDTYKNTAKTVDPASDFVALVGMFAVGLECIAVEIQQIPNQPIKYSADPSGKSRDEDDNIGWAWAAFLNDTKTPEKLIHLPAVKAAVRGMDTTQNYLEQTFGYKPNKFFVAGASKRGWMTWLTAAVDDRVFAFSPIVFDLLNITHSLHHHYMSMNGGWTFAFEPYWSCNIISNLDDERQVRMEQMADPLSYLDKYVNKPKFLITTGGDEFFILDDLKFFWNSLPGDKYLRRIPNAEHTCVGHIISLYFSLRTFFLSLVEEFPLPHLDWNVTYTSNEATIVAWMDRTPNQVSIYHAHTLNDGRRDFRLLELGKKVHPVIWLEKHVEINKQNLYKATLPMPQKGYEAFYFQFTFDSPDPSADIELTTQAAILPNYYPHEDCHALGCQGHLV
ncbi:hypothetical protein SNEBB_000793 [Seison nebaliae]|nr:hypothetical protein SNEBB_000793 [Seison nebaliae]